MGKIPALQLEGSQVTGLEKILSKILDDIMYKLIISVENNLFMVCVPELSLHSRIHVCKNGRKSRTFVLYTRTNTHTI